MSTKTKRKTNGSPDLNADASLEQIREILFGAQSRDTEEQFQALHKRLQISVTSAKDSLAQQIKEIEARLKQDVASLKQTIRDERAERSAAVKGVRDELKNASDVLHQTFTELEERLDIADEDIRTTLTSRLKETAEKFASRHDELNSLVEEEFDDVRTNTADREELSDLFRELGQRINGELKKPAPKA